MKRMTFSERSSDPFCQKRTRKTYSNPRNHVLGRQQNRPAGGPFEEAPRMVGGRRRDRNTTEAVAVPTETAEAVVKPTEEAEEPALEEEVSAPTLPHVHPTIRSLFPIQIETWSNHPVGGRTKLFLKNWEKLTSDQTILQMVGGFDIQLLKSPGFLRGGNLRGFSFSEEECTLIDQEVEKMLVKKAVRKVPRGNQILSNIFLRDKADGGLRPILNLKRVNAIVPYEHFKMEGLNSLKDLMRPGDFLVKLDLKDAYFTVPLSQRSRSLVAFEWRAETYEFEVLCFGLGSAPRGFTKILKIPLQALRKLGIRLVAYLDDFLLMAQERAGILQARDTMMFMLESLGFVINMQKSILEPTKQLEFLGVRVNSGTMTLTVPEGKAQRLLELCRETEAKTDMTARELARVVGHLIATMPAISHARIHVRYLQRVLRLSLQSNPSYQAMVVLNEEARLELAWWRVNLSHRQGKPLVMSPPGMIIQSDAATSGGWGANCQGWETGGQWTREESMLHINEQEMLAACLALKTFTKWQPVKSVLLQIDSQVALAYIAKQGSPKSLNLLRRSKEIWDYLESKQMELSVEWLPTKLNDRADFQSRNVQDSSEWKLDPCVFQEIVRRMGSPSVDLFASRTSHQLETYMAFKADPEAMATDAFQHPWTDMFPYAFPPFSLVGKVLKKLDQHPLEMILIAPVWPSQPWYPLLLCRAVQMPLLLPRSSNLLVNPKGEFHPMLFPEQNLQLAAWKVSSKPCRQREFQRELWNSSASEGGRGPRRTTMGLGGNLSAGWVKGVQIHFDAALC